MNSDYMEDINRIDSKFDKKIARLEERLNQTDVRLERNNVLTEQNTIVMQKMTESLDAMKETMYDISHNLEQTNMLNQELKQGFDGLSSKVVSLESKVDDRLVELDEKVSRVDGKSKVDLMSTFTDFFKNSLWKFLLGGGLVALILKLVESTNI